MKNEENRNSEIHVITVCLTIYCALSKENENRNVDSDSNLRQALLKALTELENEEKDRNENSVQNDSNENVVEKASALSLSIISNGETSAASQTSPSSTTENVITSSTSESYKVLLQKSQALRQETITTIEKKEEDDESILTSASSNFGDQQFGKVNQAKKSERFTNQNSITFNEKPSTKINKVETTSLAPIVSTEENEAKVENVQFFSAPLVAAFTVHQDELGLPKKVESIYRSSEQAKLAQLHKLEELGRQQEKFQLQQKQKALEDEIYRLNLNLKQQQQFFLRQQEELRTRSNIQPFIPISTPLLTTPTPLLNLVQQPPLLSSPNQVFKSQSVALQPSLSLDPIVQVGKLPLNGQFLPVKAPQDFRTPFPTLNNFSPQTSSFNQQFPNFNQNNQNGNRFFRQNTGFGNFGVNDFSKNTNSFSFTPSQQINFDNSVDGNRFFRPNQESALTRPQFLQPPQPTQLQNNRFLRSNDQLKNLLYNSGALRGKSHEDLSLISKVLSLNHFNGRNPGISLRPELQPPYVGRF
ncbi:uncharacterized protein LOC130445877 [Diorhabda sublineata]|uniref:uncharacterized protein LOC130445877 n=1 Tax=Diorhabda sublineata TaxID=1163346 RepID=UPI0024E14F39|nr:uncharacterized protein LOC130445877 [Diorhabda sublineata]